MSITALTPTDRIQPELKRVFIAAMVAVIQQYSRDNVACANAEIENCSSELSVVSKQEDSGDAESRGEYR